MRGGSAITYGNNNGNNCKSNENGYSEYFAANKMVDVKGLAKMDNPFFSEMVFNLKNKLDKSKSKLMNVSSKLKVE